MLNMIFTQMSIIGIFTTNTINYFTSKNKSDDGWRISLGLVVVPTLIITIGSLFLFDTPNWSPPLKSMEEHMEKGVQSPSADGYDYPILSAVYQDQWYGHQPFSHNPVALIIGCVLLGINHGFINHFMPFYISEMTPENHRDMLNMIFTQMSIIGIFTTNTINYFTSKNKSDDGWRISLGLAAVPSLIITIGSLFLFDTPTLLSTTNAMSKPGMCSIASTTP
ncbi:Sugar transport protein 4 [Acorus calamus]|uniref:Sugar transport protein 4 n=1 Tax=Acorus calamus TaxID=4465 RepID=A0AAV9DT00_ACOCL|nr:Sugar transport protein 4 [Acorus calamus]